MGFSPAGVAGLLLWLRADAGAYKDAGVTPAADGDGVRQWSDQSGNGRHAAQAAAGNRPVLKAGVLGGLPVVRYDGADDYLTLASALSLSGDFAIFAVHQTAGDCGLLGNAANSGSQVRVGQSGGNVLSIYDGAANPNSSALGAARTAWSLVEYVRSAGTIAFGQDGAARGTGATSGTLTLDAVGGFSAATEMINGDLAELLAFGAAPNAAGLKNLRKYLDRKYGLYPGATAFGRACSFAR